MSKSPGQNWAVYEANVQQYRVLSVTVQSFLLAVGTILFSAPNGVPITLLCLITIFGIGHVLWVWIPVVKARLFIVDYYKYQHDNRLSAERIKELEVFCPEKMYVNNPSLRSKVNEEFFKNPNLKVMRPTRIKLDFFVPGSYVIVWVFLAMWRIFKVPLP